MDGRLQSMTIVGDFIGATSRFGRNVGALHRFSQGCRVGIERRHSQNQTNIDDDVVHIHPVCLMASERRSIETKRGISNLPNGCQWEFPCQWRVSVFRSFLAAGEAVFAMAIWHHLADDNFARQWTTQRMGSEE